MTEVHVWQETFTRYPTVRWDDGGARLKVRLATTAHDGSMRWFDSTGARGAHTGRANESEGTMVQELTVREEFDGGAWTIEVTRDDFDGVTRGYIVSASSDTQLTTLHTVGVSRFWPAAVAFAECLAYARDAAERVRVTGELPAGYRPTNYRFYSERITA